MTRSSSWCGLVPVPMLATLALGGTVNFENMVGTGFPSPGQYTSLALNDGEGVIATLTRTGSGPNARFDVASIPAHWGLPASWGRNVLNPFHYLYQPNPVSGNDDMFRVDFSSPGRSVTSVRIDYGDYYDPLYLPTDGNARFQAFDSNGNMIADQTQYWNGDLALGQFGQFTFNSAVPIAYIRFWGEDDPGNNTLFWDNLQIGSVVAVPGPAAAVSGLAGLSLVAGGRLRRSRRAHCGMG